MNTFWKNLHGLSQGQLFNGGYLAPSTVASLASKENAADKRDRKRDCRERQPWPRLAAYR
jgi:hypothetical protein